MNEIPLRERTGAAAKPEDESQRTKEMLRSDWTLAAVRQREEKRREQEETQRVLKTFISDGNTTFKQKDEEERRKKGQAAETGEQLEAIRRAKVEWRERDGAEPLRAFEADHQSERNEIHAVPKSGIVRSRATTKMVRGVLSILMRVTIWGAIGFGAGVYTTPPDQAREFRAFVDSKLEEMDGLLQGEWAAIKRKPNASSDSAASVAPEPANKEIQSEVPAQPASEAPATEAERQKDIPDANAAPLSGASAESSTSQSTRASGADPVGPVTNSTPTTPTNAVNVERPKHVAKPHPKAPVKKPKPKPKPTENHREAEPAEPAPAAAEPAQQ